MKCYMIGHGAKGFPFERIPDIDEFVLYRSKIYKKIEELINLGYSTFITGLNNGADLDFGFAVIFLRDSAYYDISFEIALPYNFKPSQKSTDVFINKMYLLEMSDSIQTLSSVCKKQRTQKSTENMIDNADLILAVWNGKKRGSIWSAIKLAQKKEKKIEYIMLNEK